jgi:predicted RNase H-like HicB family nuclease
LIPNAKTIRAGCQTWGIAGTAGPGLVIAGQVSAILSWIRNNPMEYRAVIKKSGNWWIGWLIDLPGVNAQEKSREKLIDSLKIGVEDMLNTPVEPKAEEELVKIQV